MKKDIFGNILRYFALPLLFIDVLIKLFSSKYTTLELDVSILYFLLLYLYLDVHDLEQELEDLDDEEDEEE